MLGPSIPFHILNEVLSITAQEYQLGRPKWHELRILNEVLSITAQEFTGVLIQRLIGFPQ